MGRLWATLAVTCLLIISQPRPLAAETDLSDWIREKMGYIFNILGPFDPAVKSPCFHSQLDGSFACLPYFHILGAAAIRSLLCSLMYQLEAIRIASIV